MDKIPNRGRVFPKQRPGRIPRAAYEEPVRGQCLRHGYVLARCCALFEPAKPTTFLRDAIAKAKLRKR